MIGACFGGRGGESPGAEAILIVKNFRAAGAGLKTFQLDEQPVARKKKIPPK